MKVDHKDKPDTPVMVQLGNFGAKIKPKILNFRNQIKFFAFLLILYCVLTFTRTPTLTPIETTSNRADAQGEAQVDSRPIKNISEVVGTAETILDDDQKENEEIKLTDVDPKVPKVSFSSIIVTEASKPTEVQSVIFDKTTLLPTHRTTPIRPHFYKDEIRKQQVKQGISLETTKSTNVNSENTKIPRPRYSDKVPMPSVQNGKSHSSASDPKLNPIDNDIDNSIENGGAVSSANTLKISLDLKNTSKEDDQKSRENDIDIDFEKLSESISTTISPNRNIKTSTPARTSESLWTWECVNDQYCAKTLRTLSKLKTQVSQDVCWLTCGARRTLWPYPSVKLNLGRDLTAFYPDDVKLQSYTVEGNDATTLQLMKDAFEIVVQRIGKMLPIKDDKVLLQQPHQANLHVLLHITSKDSNRLSFVTDESYSLSVNGEQKTPKKLTVKIAAKTFFGIRHGLETFTQLMALDTVNDCLQILTAVEIEDKPKYPYRGLLVDTGRNFIPIPALKRVIDGMSYNKMNMFHWHITDTNSFPFYSKRVPQMSLYGAYSDREVYMPNEVADLVQYARLRGVKIIPELDAPAHAGNGWEWGKSEGLEELALCVNEEPWQNYCGQPPCGQLNPINPNVYTVLEKLYLDMLEVFDNDVFHMGGDEVMFQCWETQAIKNWMGANDFSDPFGVWAYFQWEALRRLRNASSSPSISPIIWTSRLTAKSFNGKKGSPITPADYIIQTWDASVDSVMTLLNKGYPLIISDVNVLYLDWGFGTWLGTGHVQPNINWQPMYDINVKLMLPPYNNSERVKNSFYGTLPQILGGEGALWSEKVDEDNLEIKLWPRACAIAESFWSNPSNRGEEVYNRILIQSQRMRNRGLRVDRRQPKSCDQFTGHCSDTPKAMR